MKDDMKNIVFLGNEQETRDSVKRIVDELAEETERVIRMFAFEKEEDVHACLNTMTIDLFIVDALLHPERGHDNSGMTFVSCIRNMERYRYTPVVLLSSVTQPIDQVYERLHCYAYLEGPFLEDKLKGLIHNALKMRLKKSPDKYYYLKKDGIIYVMKFSDFVYARANKRHLEIVKRDGKMLTIRYMTLKKLRLLLSGAEVIQCSKQVIINKQYIDYIDAKQHTICLLGGRGKVDIGLNYQKLFQSMIPE